MAPIVDYSHDYPEKTGKILGRVSYAELRTGEIEVNGKPVRVGSLSSYRMALEIATLLGDAIRRGDFLITEPSARLPVNHGMKSLEVRT